MAGLTTAGLDIKDLEQLLAEMVSDQIANIDPDLNTESDSVVGQLNAIYAAALFDLWQLFEEIYQNYSVETASGQMLSNLAALTGTLRAPATKATVLVHLEGTVDTVVPAGTEGYVEDDPDSRFVTTADATIAEEGATDFVEVTMEAVTEGSATKAFATDLTLTIAESVSGLDAITIQADYTPGDDEETDTELRIRREQELARPGSASAEAIRADILQDTAAEVCFVFENYTDSVDSDGLPPKSLEVLVWADGGFTAAEEQTILDEIWENKPAGTETFGTDFGTVTDSAGNVQTVWFSEAIEIRTYVEVEITTNVAWAGDSDLVKDAVAAWGATLLPGQNVYGSDIVNIVKDLEGVETVTLENSPDVLPGVDDVTPTATGDLTVSGRQIATIASLDVTVTFA